MAIRTLHPPEKKTTFVQESNTPDGIRTRSLGLRRATRYPLRHRCMYLRMYHNLYYRNLQKLQINLKTPLKNSFSVAQLLQTSFLVMSPCKVCLYHRLSVINMILPRVLWLNPAFVFSFFVQR